MLSVKDPLYNKIVKQENPKGATSEQPNCFYKKRQERELEEICYKAEDNYRAKVLLVMTGNAFRVYGA